MPSSVAFLMSEDAGLALHRRLVDGDVTAASDLATTLLDYLIGWLVETNSARIPEHMCIEAAEDALIALAKSPASFNPAKGKRLIAYLQMSAQGDLRNILQRESRHQQHRMSLESVELSPDAGKYLGTDDDPSLPMQIQEESEQANRENQNVGPARDGLTAAESQALDLVLDGERKTAAFAEVLGLCHLPPDVQQVEVKRVKDKLKKRIERGSSRNGEQS